MIRRGITERIEFTEILRVRNTVGNERHTDGMLYYRIVAQLEMAQRAIHRVLRMIVQRRMLYQLYARQRDCHDGDQQQMT